VPGSGSGQGARQERGTYAPVLELERKKLQKCLNKIKPTADGLNEMAFQIRSSTITITILLTVTAFSCSMPIFSHGNGGGFAGGVVDKSFKPKPAKLSGLLDLREGCGPGFYQIKLQGLFEGASIQVESTSDQTGRFNLVAPPGQYLVVVNKDGCGAKQNLELEENTEHMISVIVTETKAIEKVGLNEGRLPASVLIEPHK